MTRFSKVALTRNIKVDPGDTLDRLYRFLRDKGCQVFPEESCRGMLGDPDLRYYRYDELQDSNLAIVVGGDGTLLNAAREFAPYQVPIIGINLGRLGFLVDVSPQKMLHSLAEILQGQYIEEPRFLLAARVLRGETPLAEQLAFNDVVINNYFQTRMIEFFTYVDDHYVNHERADGLVIATPTGSTAYALSAGGPILHSSLDAIALVPICPHTLNHRPLVIGSNSRITIKIDPDCKIPAQVSFDGQANIKLEPGDAVHIQRSDIQVKLLHPRGYEYFDILRAKLRWGKQPAADRSMPD